VREDLITILREHRLTITAARLIMLEIFLNSNEPLTYQDFLHHQSTSFDRITIFRTLKSFTAKKIIHRIPATDGMSRYLYQETPVLIHSNFICDICKKIIPIEISELPKLKLPKGVQQQNIEIIIGGLCQSCK
jgi:Fur family ferric uptake transcriptional regulator